MRAAIARLARTRPTGYNLFHALEIMQQTLDRAGADFTTKLVRRAEQIHRNDIRSCRAMAEAGLTLLGDDERILTYCNTGALATGGIGTALGVIKHGSKRAACGKFSPVKRGRWDRARG